MKNKFSILIFTLFLMLSFGSVEQILACWCKAEPICVRTNKASTIFVGKVLKITDDEKSEAGINSFSPKQTILFQIKESFFGNKEKNTIEIKTGDEWDCNYFPFEKDSEYLVFANNDNDQGLFTGRCGGTKSITKADEDLKYLRNLPDGNQNGIISASTMQIGFDSKLKSYNSFWSAGIPFLISGNGINKNLVTDYFGNIELKDLKAGTYRLQVFMPDYYDFINEGKDESIREITLNGRGCSQEIFYPEIKNTLEGKVADKNGNPLKDIEVDLIPNTKLNKNETDKGYSAWTDDNGNFIFKKVFPRRYILGINIEEGEEENVKIFYPNQVNRSTATVIEFGLGKTLKGFNLTWQKDFKK